jgi:hypothetical protein
MYPQDAGPVGRPPTHPPLPIPTEKSSKPVVVAVAFLSLAAIAWIDYATGYEISVYALYAFPIAWITWWLDLFWGLLFSFFASAAWLWADFADGHRYAHAWIPWERAVMNLLVFAFIAFSFHQFKRNLASKSRKVKQLEGILPVCISCNRISDANGRWTDLDSYLREHSNAQAESRLCPDCAGARYR